MVVVVVVAGGARGRGGGRRSTPICKHFCKGSHTGSTVDGTLSLKENLHGSKTKGRGLGRGAATRRSLHNCNTRNTSDNRNARILLKIMRVIVKITILPTS